MKAEDWIREKWVSRIKRDEVILDERESKLPTIVVDPTTGESRQEEVVIGWVRQVISISTLADHFRQVIEDDVNFPEKRKKREGLQKANVNPDGTVKIPPKIWDRLLKEALG